MSQIDRLRSISHTHTHVAVVAARTTSYLSVGTDLDNARWLGDEASVDVLLPGELALVRALGFASSVAEAQNFVFCAKEAIYKCQYPATGIAALDFLDVRLIPGASATPLVAKCVEALHPAAEAVGRLHLLRVAAPTVGGRAVCALLPNTSRRV